jgi:hypothetical protein
LIKLQSPRRPRSATLYKRSDVARAIHGVEDAGKAIERIEIDPATGKITIVPKPGEPSGVITTADHKPSSERINSWDEVLNAQDAKRAP